jgi:hypothetical protein
MIHPSCVLRLSGCRHTAARVGDPELEKVPVIGVSKPTGTILAVAAGVIIGAAGLRHL